jgi:hypothetical protein
VGGWVGGETIGRLVHPGCGLHPPFSWKLPPHGCRDAESWVVLFDFKSLPLEALQLGLRPNHLEREMALVCHDSSPVRRRYCACNTVASTDCRVFFHGWLTSSAFLIGNMTSETHHIIYQNDPRNSRNCSIFRKISLQASCKELWSVTEKMWNRYFFVTKRVVT